MRKFLLFLLLLTACLPAPSPHQPPHPWASALRALDPADTSTPAHDITAVYLREGDDILQIRMDLLDFNNPKDLSIDIQIESDTTPQSSPLIIHIPSQLNSPRINCDPQLATVIADIPLTELPSQPRVDVSTPEDQITGLTLDGPTPTQTAPLLLTFYDTFTARFPAEALRSWDGAHTGPRGERHGLKHLLNAVEEYKIPVVLLDLKEPENLSALDAMELLSRIESLENQGLLIFPDKSINNLEFTFLEDASHLYQPTFSKITYIPIATETDTTQPSPNGPSLEVRRALLETALNEEGEDLLILGGSLADSTWGSPDMVGATMAYFASRPYVNVLSAEDLLTFPANTDNTIVPQPEEPTDEKTVLVQVALEFAQEWVENLPTKMIAQCQPEFPQCSLTNDTYLAIFDPQTASLTYLFAREGTDLHQLIAPSWQVAPGIDLFPGAFLDEKEYQVSILENSLSFISTDSNRIKTFTLKESGLEITYQMQEPVLTQVPLLVDPWTRFTPGWAENYVSKTTPNGIRWGLKNGPMVEIQTEASVEMRAFNKSLDLLTNPEDPDFAYPPGHYVPFPMAILSTDIPETVNTETRLFLSVAFP
jgi:hypothetical protein